MMDAAMAADAQSVGDSATPPGTDEDCDNDVDDDGDGDADCADDDCLMRTCVEAAPDGWRGPAVLYIGDAAAPASGGAYPMKVASGGTAVSAAAAQCSTCTCSPASPGCAGFLNFGTGADSACDGVGDCTTSLSSACAELSSPCFASVTTGYVQTQLPGGPATCSPSAQNPVVPAAGWAQNVLACAPSAALARAGCDAEEVCAHEAPFDGALCVVKSGDHACPAGAYSDRRLYYSSIDDTRGCSACGCHHDCAYTWQIFDAADAACQTPLLTLSSPNQCAAVTPSAGKIRVGATITGSGACAASGGTPTGAATAQSPITVCCVPD